MTIKDNTHRDTSIPNEKRSQNADEFAQYIIDELNRIEQEHGYQFQSLNDRVVALNHLGITTRRGGEWTKTQMSRILNRVKQQ